MDPNQGRTLKHRLFDSLIEEVELHLEWYHAFWLWTEYLTPLRLGCDGGVGEILSAVQTRLVAARDHLNRLMAVHGRDRPPAASMGLRLRLPRALAADLASWLVKADAFDADSASPRLVRPAQVEMAHALGQLIERQLYPDEPSQTLDLAWRAALEYGQAQVQQGPQIQALSARVDTASKWTDTESEGQ